MVLAAGPSADMLRWLDDALAAGRLDGDQETARSRLLAAELADTLAGAPVPAEPLRAARLGGKAERDAESALTSALLLGDPRRIDPAAFDRLLRLAFRHRIALQAAPLRERLRAFAVVMIDNSGGQWDPRGTALADSILDEAYDELHTRFAEPLSPELSRTLQRFRGLFDDRVDFSDPMYCHLQAATIAGLKGRERLARLGAALDAITASPETAEAARVFQRALLAWRAADADVALVILQRLPSHVDPQVGARANSFLTAAEAKPDAELLDMLFGLHANGWQPPSDKLASLLDGDLRVRGFLAAAASDRIGSRDGFKRAVELISDADPLVVQLRAGAVLDALLASRSQDLTGAVLARYRTTREGRGKPRPVQTMLALASDRLAAVSAEESARITARLVRALASQDLQRYQPNRWDRLAEVLQDHDARLAGKDSKRWRAEVRDLLAPDSAELRQWDELFAAAPGRPGGMFQQLLIRKTEP